MFSSLNLPFFITSSWRTGKASSGSASGITPPIQEPLAIIVTRHSTPDRQAAAAPAISKPASAMSLETGRVRP